MQIAKFKVQIESLEYNKMISTVEVEKTIQDILKKLILG